MKSKDEVIGIPTTSERMSMTLAFENLTVEIEGKTILDNISGHVKPGEVLAVMGPSGKFYIRIIYLLNVVCCVGRVESRYKSKYKKRSVYCQYG